MLGLPSRLFPSRPLVSRPEALRAAAIAGALGAVGLIAWAMVTDLTLVSRLHQPAIEAHADQQDFLSRVLGGQGEAAFEDAFEAGNRLFETHFNALDGVGANVGDGKRF